MPSQFQEFWVSFLSFPGDTGDDQWEPDKGDWVPLLYVPTFTWRWPLILYSLASHLWIYHNWKPNDIHCHPAGCGLAHSHVFLHPCPLFPGDLVYHSYHTKDALLPASWEEHFPKWLSPADVFLPFHRHQWGLSLDSYGLWPLPGHLQPSSLPYYHDLKAMCLADFRLLCLWFCHTPSWDCLDLHIAILWL